MNKSLAEKIERYGKLRFELQSMKSALEAKENEEAEAKSEVEKEMVKQKITGTKSPDERLTFTISTKKSETVRDKKALLEFITKNRQDFNLISVDLKETKKLLAKDPELKGFFDVSTKESLSVKENVKEVQPVETMAQMRERIRNSKNDAEIQD
jgi:hypothetical protein